MSLNQLVIETLPRLQKFTWRILKSKNKTHIDVNDIIHSAYILMYDIGCEFSFENIKQPIYDTIRGLNSEDNFSLSGNLTKGIKTTILSSLLQDIESKYCKGCSTTLPVAFFHKSRTYSNGIITYQTKCKECQNKANLEARKRKLSDAMEYEKFRTRENERQREKNQIIKANPLLLAHFRNIWKEETRTRRALKAS